MAKRAAAALRIPDSLCHLAVDITTLKTWPQNPRKGDLEAIRESLRVNGQFRPIVVRESDNTILAGNHTYFAAMSEGWKAIAVTFVEPRDEAHAKRIVLADNRTASLGTFDDDMLATLLESLDGESAGTGYDQTALDALLKEVAPEPLPEGSGAQHIPEQWQILIECVNEQEQATLLDRFAEDGLSCRALVS